MNRAGGFVWRKSCKCRLSSVQGPTVNADDLGKSKGRRDIRFPSLGAVPGNLRQRVREPGKAEGSGPIRVKPLLRPALISGFLFFISHAALAQVSSLGECERARRTNATKPFWLSGYGDDSRGGIGFQSGKSSPPLDENRGSGRIPCSRRLSAENAARSEWVVYETKGIKRANTSFLKHVSQSPHGNCHGDDCLCLPVAAALLYDAGARPILLGAGGLAVAGGCL